MHYLKTRLWTCLHSLPLKSTWLIAEDTLQHLLDLVFWPRCPCLSVAIVHNYRYVVVRAPCHQRIGSLGASANGFAALQFREAMVYAAVAQHGKIFTSLPASKSDNSSETHVMLGFCDCDSGRVGPFCNCRSNSVLAALTRELHAAGSVSTRATTYQKQPLTTKTLLLKRTRSKQYGEKFRRKDKGVTLINTLC